MTDAELKQALLQRRRKIDPNTKRPITWERIQQDYPLVSKALLWKISRGHVVRDETMRRALGLDVFASVPACPIPGCTETYIHLHGLQTYDPATSALYDPASQVVKPKPKPRKRSPRIAIRKDDMQSAAKTLLNNLSRDDATELVTLLWFGLKE